MYILISSTATQIATANRECFICTNRKIKKVT